MRTIVLLLPVASAYMEARYNDLAAQMRDKPHILTPQRSEQLLYRELTRMTKICRRMVRVFLLRHENGDVGALFRQMCSVRELEHNMRIMVLLLREKLDQNEARMTADVLRLLRHSSRVSMPAVQDALSEFIHNHWQSSTDENRADRLDFIQSLVRAQHLLNSVSDRDEQRPPRRSSQQSWRRLLVAQQKQHVIACLRMVPLYRTYARSASRCVSTFLQAYRNGWLLEHDEVDSHRFLTSLEAASGLAPENHAADSGSGASLLPTWRVSQPDTWFWSLRALWGGTSKQRLPGGRSQAANYSEESREGLAVLANVRDSCQPTSVDQIDDAESYYISRVTGDAFRRMFELFTFLEGMHVAGALLPEGKEAELSLTFCESPAGQLAPALLLPAPSSSHVKVTEDDGGPLDASQSTLGLLYSNLVDVLGRRCTAQAVYSAAFPSSDCEDELAVEEDLGGRGMAILESQRELRAERQHDFVRRGAARMIVSVLAGCQGKVTRVVHRTIVFACALLNGGNEDVQRAFLDELRSGRGPRCLATLEQLLAQCPVPDVDYLVRASEASPRGFEKDLLAEEGQDVPINLLRLQHEAKYARHLFRMLQLLCEGHNAAFQDFLRTQPGNNTTHNRVRGRGFWSVLAWGRRLLSEVVVRAGHKQYNIEAHACSFASYV